MNASGKYSEKTITIGMRRAHTASYLSQFKDFDANVDKAMFYKYKQDQKFVRMKESCYPVNALKRYSATCSNR